MLRIYTKGYYENVRRWLEEVADVKDISAWISESDKPLIERIGYVDVNGAIREWFESSEVDRWSMKNKTEIYEETLNRFPYI